MNILDENIPLDQRDLLQLWGFRCRVIGQELAALSIGDDNIIALLHHLKQPTLFTRDFHFFRHPLCHDGYGLAFLDLAPEESAVFIRRFLNHPRFKTKADRMGAVVRVHHDGIQFWQRNRAGLQRVAWVERR